VLRPKTLVGVVFLVGLPLSAVLFRDWGNLALVAGVYGGLFLLMYARKRKNPDLDKEYLSKAQAVIGDSDVVLAASVMAPQDKTGELIWSILKSSIKGQIVGGLGGSIVGLGNEGREAGGTLGMLTGMHSQRRENAERQGLTPVLLVAVTAKSIQLLDWPRPDQTMYVAISENSIVPITVLKVLDRASTVATKEMSGLTTLLYLGNTDTGESIALQCAANGASADGKSGKAVLAEIGLG
jgi:hypothetical protein